MSPIEDLQRAVFLATGVTPITPPPIGSLLQSKGSDQQAILVGLYWNIPRKSWYYLCTDTESFAPPGWLTQETFDVAYEVLA